LLLPLDVANNAGYAGCSSGYDSEDCGGLDMALAWEIVYCTVLVFVVFLIPLIIFYYEAEDGMGNVKESQWCSAIKYEIVVVIAAGLSLFLMYNFLGVTEIPVETYSVGFSDSNYLTLDGGTWIDQSMPPPFADLDSTDLNDGQASYPGSSSLLSMDVTFPIYVIAMMGFVGWFLFVAFAGVGLASLPIDSVCAYVYRPRHMDAIEFAEAQLSVRTRVNELIEIGELLKSEREEKADQKISYFKRRSANNMDRATVNKFKQAVFILESDVEELKLCHENFHNYNPLIPVAKLLFGVVAGLLSLMWVLQICLFILPSDPLTGFLNDYFEWFDTWFPLFGVLSVGMFSMYLYICVVQGCFKLGVRFFFFTLHPMKPNGTYMNSFLFNLGIVLLCSIPVVQFSVIAFSDYARFTNVNQIFGVQVKYLKFFSYFWTTNAFIYGILGFFVLSALYFGVKPRDNPTSARDLKDSLKKTARGR
jgi:LMBR1 domain-containing protein 1